MNTDNFANFGLRFLEILSLEYAEPIAKSEILGILSGLLRTNDYETVTQGLSFLAVLCESASIAESVSKSILASPDLQVDKVLTVEKVLNKKLVILVMKTIQKKPEIEYVHYALQIIGYALSVPSLRLVIVSEDLVEGGQV